MDNIAQEAPMSFRGRLFRPDSSRPEEQRILVLKTGIAGLRFHIVTDEEKEAVGNIVPEAELTLYREPDNKYDKWAIAVYTANDDMIGYIPRFKNETIARLMDAGKKFICIVDNAEEYARQSEEETRNEPRRDQPSPTEDMSVPVSIYMIEEV